MNEDKKEKMRSYQLRWRNEHPDYQKKYREKKLTGVKICDVCNGLYAKSYMYKHVKNCKLDEKITHQA